MLQTFYPSPDDCGTTRYKMLCCVPTLKLYLTTPLHRSEKGQGNYSKKSLKFAFLV